MQNGAPADDLQQIKGVGPAIEKTLNEMGIFRFNQIAEMSEYDIDRIAHRLKGFRSRIYREDWIGQARDLYDQKVNGQL
jgi:predicted flap endonuclease-1-like 5' DNA nuclease